MMIRNANRNISVSPGHQYTFEKVKYAIDFVNKAGRNTTINDWVEAYNYLRGTNETAQGCKACKAAKFTAAVRNYARYGYMTLLNEGYSPSDFEDKPVKVDEISKDAILAERQVETVQADDELQEENLEQEVEQLVSSITEAEVVSELTVELPKETKPKVRRRKNVKSDNK